MGFVPPYVRERPEGVEIDVLVQPRASRTRAVGEHDARLKIQLAAPPVDGEANAALVSFFADWLRVPKGQVRLVRGESSRRKTLAVAGLRAESLRPLLAALVLLCAFLLAAPAAALEVVQTNRTRLVAGPNAAALVRELATTVEADRDRVALDLGRDWDGVTEVRVGADELEFRALLPEGRRVPAWAIGVAFPAENLIVVRHSPRQSLRETLSHELSHVGLGRLAQTPLPRWFLEGLASVREEAPWAREGVSLEWAARAGYLFPLSALEHGFPPGRLDAELAYAQSADFVQFLIERAGEKSVRDVVRAVVSGIPFEQALSAATGEPLFSLEREWREELTRWSLLLRTLGQPGLLWGLLALFVVFAAFELRRRRLRRLEAMALEERQALAELFADSALEQLPAPVSEDWNEEAGEELSPEDSPAKKPTLH